MILSATASSAPVSVTWTRPCFSTIAAGPPSPAVMRSNTSLAILEEITPSSISWWYSDSISAVIGPTPASVTSSPEALAKVSTDWVIVLATSLGSWPRTAVS